MNVVPSSLQSLIDEAQRIKAETVNGTIEGGLDSVDEFVEELSRGVYSQELYLNCVADDCEEAGDWEGAKVACRQITVLDESSHFDRWKAESKLGALHALLGENTAALEHYHFATAAAMSDDSEALVRSSLSHEAWQLVRMARFGEARRLATSGLALESDFDDTLGTASLLLVQSVCELSDGRFRKFHELHQQAWHHMEGLRLVLEEYEVMQDAAGVYSVYRVWWRVRAEHLRARREFEMELQALGHSLEMARYVAKQSQIASPHTDAVVVRTLLAIVDALDRGNRSVESATYLEEAYGIMNHRLLPKAAVGPHLVPARPEFVKPHFSWWR